MRLLLVLFLLFLTTFVNLRAQRPWVIENDTILDFWTEKSRDNYFGEGVKHIERDKKLIYISISHENSDKIKQDLVRINDSIFYSKEYYLSGYEKRFGDYFVTNIIHRRDTALMMDSLGDDFGHLVHHYKLAVKNGWWEEDRCDTLTCYGGEYWKGLYSKGKKTGTWKHILVEGCSDLELERINYDSSANSVYVKNLAASSSSKNFESILQGTWHDPYADEPTEKRKSLDRAPEKLLESPLKTTYTLVTFEDGKFTIQIDSHSESSYKSPLIGTYQINKKDGTLFLTMNFKGKRPAQKYKILYLEKDRFVIDKI